VVLDRTLLQSISVTRGLKPGGWVLVNSPAPPYPPELFSGYRLAHVDATRIALNLGLGTRTHPIVNTAIMGAFARMLEMPPMEVIARIIQEEAPTKPEENIRAAREAYAEVLLESPRWTKEADEPAA
jgi:Pyruvate/2-oxoacid:ferredoxin oxidoreductase gamma subunit